jgi:glutathione peroxidase
MTTFHDFEMKTIDGEPKKLSDYKGNVLLVVNVASRCGLTPQYEGLEKLQRELKDKGFTVLGFPCNDFGAQEPGTEDEIKQFCSTTYDVSFPMFSKIHVKGPEQAPLYAYLTREATSPDGPGDIGWNFAKFIIGKDGRVIARLSPTADPAGADVRGRIEAALSP